MARTIAAIMEDMTKAFMADETLAVKYGFAVGSDFNSFFSKVSIERIMYFVAATSIWMLESLFDSHKNELSNLIDTKKPHRLKWYRDKALSFQYGRSLELDSDVYAEVIESEMVVKYASAVEYQGRLYVKVAGGTATKEPLPMAEQTALESYFSEIKDAGVILELVNEDADHYALEMDIYYDPMVFNANGLRLDSGADTVRDMIKDFVQNQIPFNGEYRNALVVDALQKLNGVVIPELKVAKTCSHAAFIAGEPIPWQTIQAKHLPVSGYYKVYDPDDLQLTFIPYQTIESL